MRSLGHDVRLGIRGLLKSPGFTIIAVLTLTMGIGATTATYVPGNPRGSDGRIAVRLDAQHATARLSHKLKL